MTTTHKFLLIIGLAAIAFFVYKKSGSVAPIAAANDNSSMQIAPYFMTYNMPAQSVPTTTIAQSNAVAALNVTSPAPSSVPSNTQVPSTMSSSNWCGCGS